MEKIGNQVRQTGGFGPGREFEQETPFGHRPSRQKCNAIGSQVDTVQVSQQAFRAGWLAELKSAPALAGGLCQACGSGSGNYRAL